MWRRLRIPPRCRANAVRINGRRAVYIPILKQAGANTIAVIDGVTEVIATFDRVCLKGMQVKLIFDQSLYIRNAIHTLEHEMLLGGGLGLCDDSAVPGQRPRPCSLSLLRFPCRMMSAVILPLLYWPDDQHHDAGRVGLVGRDVSR